MNQPAGERSLAEWLDWQQRQPFPAIALGLDRVAAVAARLDITPGDARVLTIAGTNGKGSCALAAEALARAGGLRVGCYTSPHLLRYNERVRIGGQEVSDSALCRAFTAIEQVRGDTPLTYFEYGTLAALWLFRQAGLELWILEVGLGGRLDAVNLVDADVAVITSIGLDHQAWLGEDRDAIGREKAGVARAGRPLLLGELTPPDGLLAEARARRADLRLPERDYRLIHENGRMWRLRGREAHWSFECPPGLVAVNAALAVLALEALGWPPAPATCREVLAALHAPGRCELSERDGHRTLYDVAHNLEAAGHLADWLTAQGRPRWTAVFAALGDKPVEAMTAALAPHVDRWYLAPLPEARALPTAELAKRLPAGSDVRHCASVAAAMQATARCPQRLVWGSFLTVAAAKESVDG